MFLFSVKMRFFLLLWGGGMLILSIGATYAGVLSLMDFLSFPSVIDYSAGMIALIFSFLIISPLSFAAFYSSVKGERLPEYKSLFFFRVFMISVVFSVLFSISFDFFYMSKLKQRKYIACKGIPSGWMPGMATKYAINESLCHKN